MASKVCRRCECKASGFVPHALVSRGGQARGATGRRCNNKVQSKKKGPIDKEGCTPRSLPNDSFLPATTFGKIFKLWDQTAVETIRRALNCTSQVGTFLSREKFGPASKATVFLGDASVLLRTVRTWSRAFAPSISDRRWTRHKNRDNLAIVRIQSRRTQTRPDALNDSQVACFYSFMYGESLSSRTELTDTRLQRGSENRISPRTREPEIQDAEKPRPSKKRKPALGLSSFARSMSLPGGAPSPDEVERPLNARSTSPTATRKARGLAFPPPLSFEPSSQLHSTSDALSTVPSGAADITSPPHSAGRPRPSPLTPDRQYQRSPLSPMDSATRPTSTWNGQSRSVSDTREHAADGVNEMSRGHRVGKLSQSTSSVSLSGRPRNAQSILGYSSVAKRGGLSPGRLARNDAIASSGGGGGLASATAAASGVNSSSRYLLTVIPPSHLPHDPPHPRTNPQCSGYGPPEHFK